MSLNMIFRLDLGLSFAIRKIKIGYAVLEILRDKWFHVAAILMMTSLGPEGLKRVTPW
jgi:hypothetical protein